MINTTQRFDFNVYAGDSDPVVAVINIPPKSGSPESVIGTTTLLVFTAFGKVFEVKIND